jgi:hypothetical protein
VRDYLGIRLTERPPNLLDYERHPRRKRRRRKSDSKELWIGLAAGLVSSVFVWYAFFTLPSMRGASPVICFLTAKLFLGLVLTGSHGWLHFGRGILLSLTLAWLAVVAVVFFRLFR